MCTVTAVAGHRLVAGPGEPLPRLRVVFSRDEKRTRAAASPPELRAVDGHRALMPIDGAAGGTWIAVTEWGLVLGLLNVTRSTTARPAPGLENGTEGLRSRGTIIPALTPCETLPRVIEGVRQLRAGDYPAFRLLAFTPGCFVEALSNGRAIRLREFVLDHPVLRTSSSLGDRTVARPRRGLFRAAFSGPVTRAAQDAFHVHRWPDRPHLSVHMARPEARTMSITTVEIGDREARMSYEAVHEPARTPVTVQRFTMGLRMSERDRFGAWLDHEEQERHPDQHEDTNTTRTHHTRHGCADPAPRLAHIGPLTHLR